jgi:hypothetical protein
LPDNASGDAYPTLQNEELRVQRAYLPNIADWEVLNEVSQIVLKIDIVRVI